METISLKTGAPMPKKEEDLKTRAMKLYTYFVCISGLAKFPENTRMFRHKNICYTEIIKRTGITKNITIKRYIAYLEYEGKITYKPINNSQGKQFNREIIENYIKSCNGKAKGDVEKRKAMDKHIAEVLKSRNKEDVYLIKRPNPYTEVLEETLVELNEVYKATDEEIKLYLLCCGIRDKCSYLGKKSQIITLESLREILLRQLHNETDGKIKRGLVFLKGLGLIDFNWSFFYNTKKFKIECVELTDVSYWIEESIREIKKEDVLTKEELEEIWERIEKPLKTKEE